MNACRHSLALCIFTAAIVALAGARQAKAADLYAIERYDGLAHALSNSALVYRETHWLFQEEGRAVRLVLYRCPNGDAFARKRVVETPSAVAPDFDFVDGRDGYREGVTTQGTTRRVYWQANAETDMRERELTDAPNMVIDAGFDAMIRLHWQQLTATGSISAKFLLPSRQDYLPVVIRKQTKSQISGTIRMRMALDTWYGFAAPATELVYRVQDRSLASFEGIGTIRDAKGRHQAVRIEFPDRLRVTQVDEGEIESAEKTPLDGSCQG